jgi:hypothetical protein
MKLLTFLAFALLSAMTISPLQAEDTPLAKEMDSMNSAFKAINKEKDAAKGAELARKAQEAVMKSITLVPTLIADIKNPQEKEKALADYRRLVGESYVVFCKMEIAFLEGKMDEVTQLADAAKALKKEGHKKYIEEE